MMENFIKSCFFGFKIVKVLKILVDGNFTRLDAVLSTFTPSPVTVVVLNNNKKKFLFLFKKGNDSS